MTLEEFVKTIQNFDHLDRDVQTDLLSLYLMEYEGNQSITATVLESLRSRIHLSGHPRLAQYLSEQAKTRKGCAGRYTKKAKGYSLERGYLSAIKTSHLGRVTATHVKHSLRATLSSILDRDVRSYLEEAITCFEQNLLRSSVILTWCVAYSLFRGWLFKHHLAELNTAMAGWKNPVQISKIEDFQELVESVVIDTARKAGLLTKEQHKTLKQLLDQRNSYAHPSGKLITPSIAEAYIETTLHEVVSQFS